MADRWVRASVVRWLSGLLVSVAAVAAISVLVGLLDPRVPVLSLLVLYILAVLAVALVWGTGLAVVTAVLSTAVFAYLFLVPIHSVRVADSRELAALGVFLVTAVVMGEVAARSRGGGAGVGAAVAGAVGVAAGGDPGRPVGSAVGGL
jgi:K+-sensing histidine kinase KdpD